MNLPLLVLLSIGHMVTDIHQGAVPGLMIFLRDAFHLNYTQVGMLILISNLSSSVVQPLFGLYSDTKNIFWLMPLGIGLAAVGISLTGIMPYYYLVVAAVFISGLGIAAYHPEGAKIAYFAAGTRKSSAMSVFSVGGNLGYGLGPILVALFMGAWGLTGSLAFLGPGLVVAVAFHFLQPKIAAATFRARETLRSRKEQGRLTGTGKPPWSWGLFLLVVLVIIRSWIHYGMVSYLPFYYTDYLGGDKKVASVLVSVFLIAGAAGTILGGLLADRFGTKKHLCLTMALMVPLLFLVLNTTGAAALVVIALAGMVLISTFSPTLVMGQQYLPYHIGLASGLLTGFSVGVGGLGVPVLGKLADLYGVDLVLQILTVLPVIGLGLALALPRPPAVETRPSAATAAQ